MSKRRIVVRDNESIRDVLKTERDLQIKVRMILINLVANHGMGVDEASEVVGITPRMAYE